MDLAFPPGTPPAQPGPLARFLPPLEAGMTLAALEGLGRRGDRVLDPFGASPRLVLEAAQAGRGVLVACNNPITRFVLRRTLQPFSLSDLQLALARMGAAPKDGSRVEVFLLDLYRTTCAQCGGSVSAEAFVWDRDRNAPVAKIYACPHCHHAGEDPVSPADVEAAREHAEHGLQRALALERVAPQGDPDREHAEAALAVYPGRASFALITLINKLEQLQLEPPLDEAVRALLLSAFDEANALWGHPEGRARPLQLVASARYLEANVWRALERAMDVWALDDPGVPVRESREFDDPEPGSVVVFPAPVRELLGNLHGERVQAVLAVLPRPNQAYWTLSALWAAWLWGKEAAAPIKVALRRRRYEWSWHAAALRTALGELSGSLRPGAPALTIVPEAEPGFFAAAVAGLERAGFRLESRALRTDTQEAVLRWEAGDAAPAPSGVGDLSNLASQTIEATLRSRGEAAAYPVLHAAVWSEIAGSGAIPGMWEATQGHVLSKVGDTLEAALADRVSLARLDSFSEPESGVYWLTDPQDPEEALADRSELSLLELLRGKQALSELDADLALCARFTGLLTPERRLVRAILRSYADPEAGTSLWRLRDEDRGEARARDVADIREALQALGERLGYGVTIGNEVCWLDEEGEVLYAFRVLESALLGRAPEAPASYPLTFVLPGGRASLVAAKAARDPRLKRWLSAGIRIVKFRHIRRLLVEPGLSRVNLFERLSIDPPEHLDPQLPLL